MGMMSQAVARGIGAVAGLPGAGDDYWYRPLGGVSVTGLSISLETALKASAVWACVSLIADSVGMLPCHVFERLARGRMLAERHPLTVVLGQTPNPRQTPSDFKAFVTAHALLNHGGYAEIIPGALGAVDQLRSLDSRWVTPEPIPGDRLRFVVNEPGQPKRTINQESMFRINGLSLDGCKAISVAEQVAVEAIGLSLATERYGASFFGQGARPSGFLKMGGRLTREGAAELREYWASLHGGLSNAHRPAVLEEGSEWVPTSTANEEAQYLETREHQVAEICRFFRVPPFMVGAMEKATTWGTGIESMGQGFVSFTLGPWLTRWEEAIDRDLITATNRYYARFVPAALLRGDTKTRYEAYQIAAGGNAPFMTVNEVRELEDRNPLPGGDVLRSPLNMGPASPPPGGGGSDGAALAATLARTIAASLVHKEVTALTKAARRCAHDATAWRAAVLDFYADHQADLMERLCLSVGVSGEYIGQQTMALLSGGAGVMADWETRRVDDLVRLTLGE